MLYRQQENNGITRIGNQIYETPIKERIVGIDNRQDLNPEKAHDLEEAHKNLIRFGNPLQKQLFDYQKNQDRQINTEAIERQKASNKMLYNNLSSDLDDLI